jgi:hypothetical protein
MAQDSSKAKLYEAVPVFLVSDIAATMQWYSATLGFNWHNIVLHP